MRPFNQMELNMETIFKDSVLSLAEAQSMEIIAEAGRKRARELDDAQRHAANAEYEVVKEQYRQERNKEFTSVAAGVRRELLAYREELVDGMFKKVEERLVAFRQSEGYTPWAVKALLRHKGLVETGASLTVYLRSGDEALKEALSKEIEGLSFETDGDIRLGGIKISDGHRLFDETLDGRLREEKERFYETSGLYL